jgi:hypothetical protein
MEEAKGWISVLCSVRLSWVRPGRGAPYAWAHGAVVVVEAVKDW